MNASTRLVHGFLDAHPADAAALLETLPAEEVAATLEGADAKAAAALLRHMAPAEAAWCLSHMETRAAAAALSAMAVDLAAALLRRLGREGREAVLARVARPQAEPLRRLLDYPDGTAGALMDPRILAVPSDLTVGEALGRVRRSPEFTLYYVYVVDRDQKLVGVLNLRELMLAEPEAAVMSSMHRDVASIRGGAVREQVLAHPAWRRLHALPITDEDGVFLGAIRYETLRGLEQEDPGPHGAPVMQTAVHFGELCWIGMAGMLAGLGAVAAPLDRAAGAGTEEGA